MSEQMSNKKAASEGLHAGIPIALGYFAVAFALGIPAKSAGLSAFQAGVMSLTMLASAGEFAAITLIASGAGVLEMITTTIIVNLRYMLMSAALSQKLDHRTPFIHRFPLSYCITDEIFGASVSVDGRLNPLFTYACASISAIGWTAGTVLGVLAGNILPAVLVNALSVALYGMFLAIIIPPAKKEPFIGGLVVISMLASLLFTKAPVLSRIPSGFRIILLTLLIAGAAALIRPIKDDEKGGQA